MDPFWIVVIVILGLYKLYTWDSRNKRLQEYERTRNLIRTYTDRSTQEFPELKDAFWNPNRAPLPSELRPQVLQRTDGHCFYCDQDLSNRPAWQIDHVWPYRYGGSNELINLVPSCSSCNSDKWAHLPPRFLLHKWVIGTAFTKHELALIEYYRKESMANLIGTSAHWKGRANYWQDHVYNNFANLITQNENLCSALGKRRDQLLSKTYAIYEQLDCDIAMKGSKYKVIEDWLATQEWVKKNWSNEIDRIDARDDDLNF
jgi:hypothetical protein